MEKSKRGIEFHYSFLVFVVCCSITFISVALYFSCNGIFVTPVSEYFGVGRGAFAVSGTIMSIVLGIVSPFVGAFIEKHSFKRTLIVFLLIQVFAYVIQANARSIFIFYFTGALHGIVHSLMMLLVVPTIINRWFAVRRGLFVGLASSMSGVGGIVWNAVAGPFMEANGWQATYMLYAILIACIPLPLAVFVLHDYPSDKNLKPYGYSEESITVSNVNGETVKSGVTASKAVKTTAFKMLTIMCLCINAVNCFTSYIPSYATSLGLSISFGATLTSVMGFGILVGKNCTGIIFDKNVNLGIFTAIGIPAIGFVLVYIFGNTAPELMPIGTALYGISYAGNPVLLPLLVMHVFGTKEYGKILGTINMYGSIVGAVVGVAYGYISDIPGGTGFIIIIASSGACAAVACIAAMLAVRKAEVRIS